MAEDVRAYYSQVTKTFLRMSTAAQRTGSLHRSLRLPPEFADEVAERPDPLDAIHHVLYALFRRYGAFGASSPLIGDLGCGIGATVEWFRCNTPAHAVGITISAVQAELAGARTQHVRRGRAGAGRVDGAVTAGSFTNEADLERMSGGRLLHGAFMIESFVHADAPETLFRVLAGRSLPGAVLIIVDDVPTEGLLRMLAPAGSGAERAERRGRPGARRTKEPRRREYGRLVRDFREGWHIHTFLPPERVGETAAQYGWRLREVVDLSDHIIRNRPRDLVARAVSEPVRRIGLTGSWWDNVLGGSALQRLSHRRAVRYQALVLQRTASAAGAGSMRIRPET